SCGRVASSLSSPRRFALPLAAAEVIQLATSWIAWSPTQVATAPAASEAQVRGSKSMVNSVELSHACPLFAAGVGVGDGDGAAPAITGKTRHTVSAPNSARPAPQMRRRRSARGIGVPLILGKLAR